MIIIFPVFSGNAQPGSIDSTFATSGKAMFKLGFPHFEVTSACEQSDGKIIIAGSAMNINNNDLILIRLKPDGKLDLEFGTGGVVYTPVYDNDVPSKIVLLPDGSFYVGGNSVLNFKEELIICKFKSDGTLDPTFNLGRYLSLMSSFQDMAVQPDGKLYTCDPLGKTISRYDVRGGVDRSFVQQSIADSLFTIKSITVQPDGKVLIAGFVREHLFLARYLADGKRDLGFGNGGRSLVYSFDAEQYGKVQVSLGANGIVNIMVQLFPGSNENYFDKQRRAYMQCTESGKLITTRGNKGLCLLTLSDSNFYPYQSIFDPEGNIVVAGVKRNSNGIHQMAVSKFDSEGLPDGSFGSDGQSSVLDEGPPREGLVPLVLANGKIVVAGYELGNGQNYVAVACFNTIGTPDKNFGNNSVTTVAVGAGKKNLKGIAQTVLTDKDGNVYVAGYTKNGSFNSIALMKMAPSGLPDKSFGKEGISYAPVAEEPNLVSAYFPMWAEKNMSMAKDKDGNLYIAAPNYNYFTSMGGCSVYRFTANGDLDDNFGYKGIVRINTTTYAFPLGIAIQSNGKPVVAVGASGSLIKLTRLTQNGSVDLSFGINGVLEEKRLDGDISLGNGTSRNEPGRLTIQPDDKILLTGRAKYPHAYEPFSFVRYNSNGFVDSTLGNEGLMATRIADNKIVSPEAILVQPDKKIIVGGSLSSQEIFVARFDSLGRFDKTFGNEGIKIGLKGTHLNRIIKQADGKILLAADNYEEGRAGYNKGQMVVNRLNEDGTVDKSFGDNGATWIQSSSLNQDLLGDMAIDENGRIFLTGATEALNFNEGFADWVVYCLKNKMEEYRLSVKGFSPKAGGKGSILHISGTKFSDLQSVTIGGISARSARIVAPDDIEVVLGDHVVSGDIVVDMAGVKFTLPGFTYIPKPILTAEGPTTFVAGDSVVLRTAEIPGYSYHWSMNGMNISRGNGSKLTVTQAGRYLVQVFFEGYWVASNDVEITVVNTSAPYVITINPSTAKAETSVTITGLNFTGVTSLSFGGITAKSFKVISPTTIEAIVGDGSSGDITLKSGKGSGSFSGFNYVPQPTITASGPTTFSNGGYVVLKASPGTGYYFQWQKDGVNIADAMDSSYKVTESGVYTVAISLNSVVSQPAPDISVTKLPLKDPKEDLHVFPNPFENVLSIDLGSEVITRTTLTVYSLEGKQVMSADYTNLHGVVSVDLSKLKGGTYILRLPDNTSGRVIKILKR
ncbi:T9SS type A sorting domain-containing protein [Desertivirga arenae]|uniref:T9SS type A sorting domain-containing protein n=1 Tax=Desertivirga arenae TaxID=2810309 RepID=UPI001A958BF6|nr:T9SS type A sorting domain-containing protein [Pedobacter sp. SYSU D00823]